MGHSYDALKDSFRSSLPNSCNRDMWVNETYLEFRRFIHLREKGFGVYPRRNSLLGIFLSLSPDEYPTKDDEFGFNYYNETFGHLPTYCWTSNISELSSSSAPGGQSQPGNAWMDLNGHDT